MSTINENGLKILLPRTGTDEFWQIVHTHFAEEDVRKWKYLAMLALRENAGWQLEHIGFVFSHNKGHIARCLKKIKADLKQQFGLSPDWLELSETDRVPIATPLQTTTTNTS